MALRAIKLRLRSSGKWDFDLDNAGRLKVATGSDKLAIQIARAVMNQTVFNDLINVPVTNVYTDTINTNLKIMKSVQILMTNEIPNIFEGYHIYKSLDGLDYNLLTSTLIEKSFIDENVENEKEYFYRFTQTEDGIESDVVSTISVRPTRDSLRQNIYILGNVLVQEDDNRIIFMFRNKRTFSAAELLDSVQGIEIVKGTQEEPRLLKIRVRVMNLAKSISDLTLNLGG